MKIVVFASDPAALESLSKGDLSREHELTLLPDFQPLATEVSDALIGADILVFGSQAAQSEAARDYVLRELPPRMNRLTLVLVALPSEQPELASAWEAAGMDDVIFGELNSGELELRLRLAVERIRDRRAMQLIERAINTTPDAFLITKGDPLSPEIIYTNAGFEEMTGFPTAEVAGRSLFSLESPETDRKASDRLRQAIRESRPATEEITQVRKDGGKLHIELSFAPIYSGGSKPSHFIGVQRNITRRPGSYVKESNQDQLAGSILEGVKEAIIALDQEGRVTFVNKAMERLLGKKRAELVNGSVYQAIPGYDGSPFQKKFQQVRDEHHAVTFTAQIQGLNAWYEIQAFPSQHGLVASCRDISATRQSDQIFSLLKAAVDALDESIIITDSQVDLPGPRILYANEAHCRLTGYQFAEMIGQTPRIFQGPKTEAKVLDRVRRKMLAGVPVTAECTNYRKDGSEYNVQWNVSPIRDRDGKITNFISVQRDMTTRLREQEELMQSRKLQAVGELAGGIAHEFNNLLSPMVIQTEQILDQYGEDADLREALQPIQQAIHQSSALCRRILMLGRKDDEKKALVSVNELVTETVELLNRTIDRRIELNTVLDKNLLPLVLSRVQIFQVLMNLILNARDTLLERLNHPALSSGDWVPHITISTDSAESNPPSPTGDTTRKMLPCQRIVVADNGMGMSEETRQRLFEPFFTTKDPGTGTGLGLATTWNIVQSLKGWMDVESYQGEGSTFSIYLPVTPESLMVKKENDVTDTTPIPHIDTSKKTILSVDDNELLRKTMCRLLEKDGHAVTCAEDGQIALEFLTEDPERFELIITDQNLPKLSGVDLINQLREKGLHTPIILMSGFLSEQTRREITDLGVEKILDKPVTPTEMLQAIAEAAAQSAAKS